MTITSDQTEAAAGCAKCSQSRPKRGDKIAVVSAITAAISACAAIGALVLTGNQVNIAEQGQFADRFNKAVEQISQRGAEMLPARLRGIYAMERLAQDSPRDQPDIIRVLTEFIRSMTPKISLSAGPTECPPQQVPIKEVQDVQAALNVLKHRDPSQDAGTKIDLDSVCLFGADLSSANFAGANLYRADLSKADLTSANLSRANLYLANMFDVRGVDIDLSDANLHVTRLSYADLTNANLTNAHMDGANLSGSSIENGKFSGATLVSADFTDANLSYADLSNTLLLGTNLSRVIHTGTLIDGSAGGKGVVGKGSEVIGKWW